MLVNLSELFAEVDVCHLVVFFVLKVGISSHVCIISAIELEDVSEWLLALDLYL